MKKIVSLILSCLVVVGSIAAMSASAGATGEYLPQHKSANGAYYYVVYDNKYAELTYFNGLTEEERKKNVYEIPSEVDGYEVRYLDSFLYSDVNDSLLEVNKVIIPDTVTHIGYHAFSGSDEGGQSMFSEVVIPSSVTEIGDYAFYDCPYLESVTLPENIRRIGGYAFSHCGRLSEVNLPDTIETIPESCFKDCVSLKSIKLPAHSLSIEKNAFYNCPKLKTLNVTRKCDLGAYAFGFKDYLYDEGEEYAHANRKISGATINVIYTQSDGTMESYIGPITDFADIYGIKATYDIPTSVKKVSLPAGATFKMLFDGQSASEFKSSDAKVIKVSNSGNITALKKGKATISAKLKNGNTFSLKVKIAEDPSVYELRDGDYFYCNSLMLYRGQTKKLFAYGKANGADLKFKNTSIAKFTSKKSSRDLKIKGLKTGKTTLKIRINGVWRKIKVTVK